MVLSSDISVVVQGAVSPTQTPKCLQSIREILPEAEIILSTWENSNVEGLDVDILILNKDPGGVLVDSYKSKTIYNNLNRQLLSTKEGLKHVTRKYTLKLRSDLILTNKNFLEMFEKFDKRIDDYKLFEHKVLVPMLFTRYNIKLCCSKKRYKIPFHVSDWWFFGLSSDIKKYFENTPLVEEPLFTKYFEQEENKTKNNPYGKLKHKFAPEQYFCNYCFSSYFDDLKMQDAADFNEELVLKYQKCLLNNFIVLDFEHSGIYLNKYSFSKNEKYTGDQYIDLYNFYRFEKDYQMICDKNYKPESKFITDESPECYAKMRIYKHIHKVIDSKSSIWKKFEEIIAGIPIAVIKYYIIKIAIILNKEENEIAK